MRSLTIARGLEQHGNRVVTRAWFSPCAHGDNATINRYWDSARAVLPSFVMAPVWAASDVVRAGKTGNHRDRAAWMRDRYRLRGN